MKGGALEILLVSAEGLKHARLLRSSSQYVVIQCGNCIHTSKITSGKNKRVWWNEKFIFKMAYSEWKPLVKIKLIIMEKDKYLEDCSVGEATVYLRGILREANEKGSIELKPAPYNVVLKDGTYAGELKVGLKFNTDVEVDAETIQGRDLNEKQPQSTCRPILNFTLRKIGWPRFFFFQTCLNRRGCMKCK